jgi:antitoxin VapB
VVAYVVIIWYISFDEYHVGVIMSTARIFKNGRSQAVRLPKDFRLSGKVVFISHVGNGVLLRPMPMVEETWLDVYNAMTELDDFMESREDLPAQEREEF